MFSQDSGESTRQSLDTLQLNVMEKNSPSPAMAKISVTDYFKPSFQKRRMTNKSTQVHLESQLSHGELCEELPSENYWRTVAEKRRTALSDALIENETLHQQLTMLTEENEKYKQLLEEANSFIEVFKELLQEDDTGIDVRDMSTLD